MSLAVGVRGIAVSLLFGCLMLSAQQDGSAPGLLLALKSPNVQQRIDAYEKLKRDQDAVKRSDVQAALVDLLDRENRLIHGVRLVDPGEGYAEYVSDLMGTVAAIADWRDQRQACILAEGPYNPDSKFADELAVKGGSGIAACLLKIAEGDIYGRQDSRDVLDTYRQQAIPVIVHLEKITADLSPTIRTQLRQAITSGLRDPAAGVRLPTIEALGRFGRAEWIPKLEDVARSDPQSRVLANGQRRFDVRDAATKAIESIKDRAKSR